jgi:hypothetical protein
MIMVALLMLTLPRYELRTAVQGVRDPVSAPIPPVQS